MGEPLLKVLQAGMLSTVQDRGRFRFQNYGFTTAGAMDDFALRIGNRLVGNKESAAAIELTFHGGTFLTERECIIAVTGADLSPQINGIDIPMWQSIYVEKGSTISLSLKRSGIRAYLCVQGGIDVPVILGSQSTDLKSDFGGYEGRKLKKEDVINGSPEGIKMEYCHRFFPTRLVKENYKWDQQPTVIRVIPGPELDHFTNEGYNTFLANSYEITEKSDRHGYQLTGPKIEHSVKGPNILTNYTPLGAVQIPGAGTPIVLMKDRQTTGGYPKIATVITPDISKLAQKGPGEKVIFTPVEPDIAREIYLEYENVISKTPMGIIGKKTVYQIKVLGKNYIVNVGEVKE